ncbi:MAG: alpha/beta hydrolase [Cyclobacteriaceae bacterium]
MQLNIFVTTFSLCFVILSFVGCSSEEIAVQKIDFPIETEIELDTETATIYGTLTMPNDDLQFPIVLIVPGSGPTDRNGNNSIGLFTNTYKMISDTLAFHGIASLRYDKRGVGKSFSNGFNELDLTFEDYISDTEKWIAKLEADGRFNRIFVLGHSQGALIGSIVSSENVIDGFISVAGTAQSAGLLILEQLSAQHDDLKTEAETIISSLNNGVLVEDVSSSLLPLFRPDIQPYLISWFKYDPKTEIAKVTSPILILHGSTDLQIESTEAPVLANNNLAAEFVIIDNMNHVLKDASDDYDENIATYSNPNLPLSIGFSSSILSFIEKVIKG